MEEWNCKNIRLIAFDVDGTLAETDDYFVEKGVVLSRKVLPFVKAEKMEKIVRLPVMFGETCLHALYRVLDILGLDGLVSRIHSNISVKKDYKYSQVEGMRDVLELLSKSYILGIISSGGKKSTEAFIDKFKLGSFISYVISAEDCRFIKPHPMPLLKMAEEAGVPIENCLMVGDTVFDIFCAKSAGAHVAAVRSGFDTDRFLSLHHPDLILNSVKDLPKVLRPQESDRAE